MKQTTGNGDIKSRHLQCSGSGSVEIKLLYVKGFSADRKYLEGHTNPQEGKYKVTVRHNNLSTF